MVTGKGVVSEYFSEILHLFWSFDADSNVKRMRIWIRQMPGKRGFFISPRGVKRENESWWWFLTVIRLSRMCLTLRTLKGKSGTSFFHYSASLDSCSLALSHFTGSLLSYHPTHKLKYQKPTLTVSVYKIYLPSTYHSATQKLLKMRGFFLKKFWLKPHMLLHLQYSPWVSRDFLPESIFASFYAQLQGHF